MTAFTTWGRWEEVRVMIKNELLTNKVIDTEETVLDDFLLNEVTTTMLDESNDFLKNNLERWRTEKKQLMLDSYGVCLGSIVRVISEKFNLSVTQKRLFLMPAIEHAHLITSEMIDNLLVIGDFCFKIKNELLFELYGDDFQERYAELMNGVYVYDPELSLKIKSAIISKVEKIATTDTLNQSRLRAHGIFISEVIQQIKTEQNFEELFKQKTGKSMKDYKEEISQNKYISSEIRI